MLSIISFTIKWAMKVKYSSLSEVFVGSHLEFSWGIYVCWFYGTIKWNNTAFRIHLLVSCFHMNKICSIYHVGGLIRYSMPHAWCLFWDWHSKSVAPFAGKLFIICVTCRICSSKQDNFMRAQSFQNHQPRTKARCWKSVKRIGVY